MSIAVCRHMGSSIWQRVPGTMWAYDVCDSEYFQSDGCQCETEPETEQAKGENCLFVKEARLLSKLIRGY